MTLIAQLDTSQSPPVVLWLYDYGDDAVPGEMVPPEYEDVSDVRPRVEPGMTYDGEEWREGEPQKQQHQREGEATKARGHISRNDDFLANENPTPDDVVAQVRRLTEQVSMLLADRLAGVPEFEPPKIDLEPVEPPGETPPIQAGQPPVASFTFDPPEPNHGDDVTFDASGSTGAIASYAWFFEDGAYGSGETATYQYTRRGDYPVILTVTDDQGATDQASQTVTVT